MSLQSLMRKVKTGHTNARAVTVDDFTAGQRFGNQKWKLLFIYTIFMCIFLHSFSLPASPNSLPDSIICPHKVRSLCVMLRFISLLFLREPNNEPSANMKK